MLKFTTETPDRDLFGEDFITPASDVLYNSDLVRVSRLEEGVETNAYLQAGRLKFENSWNKGYDYDTFLAELDAGDTYQIRLTVEDPSHFQGAIGIYGSSADSYVNNASIIVSVYDHTFNKKNSLLTDTFVSNSGALQTFTVETEDIGTYGAHPYSLELIKVEDVEPWSLTASESGGIVSATLAVGDRIVTAGSTIELSVFLEKEGLTSASLTMLAAGSLSTSQYYEADTFYGDYGLHLTATVTPSVDIALADLLKITLPLGFSANEIEVTDLSISIDSEAMPVETIGFMDRLEGLTLDGDETSNSIYGGIGNDLIRGFAGNDGLTGWDGNDTLIGGGDHDVLDGGFGNDNLKGQSGNDWLRANWGNDKLFGNGGDDTLVGGAGKDKLVGGGGNDHLNAGKGDDVLFGGAGIDTMTGAKGNDILNGDAGDDQIYGWAGSDILRGGTGNDRLIGQRGRDTLDGGAGNDEFEFRVGDGVDTILDFEDDVDTLVLDANLWGGDLSKGQVLKMYAIEGDDSVTLDFGKDKIVVEGIGDALLLQNDIAFL